MASNNPGDRRPRPALYVEPQTEPINLGSFPENGSDFLRIGRIEAESLFQDISIFNLFEKDKNDRYKSRRVPEPYLPPGCTIIPNFLLLAMNMKYRREEIMKKFPQSSCIRAVEDEELVCLFLNGSKLYRQLYPGNDGVRGFRPHLPLLSIVMYLSQDEVFTILKYLCNWIMKSEKERRSLGVWSYAMLACLHGPLSVQCDIFLEEFYFKLTKKNGYPEKSKQLTLLTAILSHFFLGQQSSLI